MPASRVLDVAAGNGNAALAAAEDRLRQLFGSRIAALHAPRKDFIFRYRSPQHWLDTFRTY